MLFSLYFYRRSEPLTIRKLKFIKMKTKMFLLSIILSCSCLALFGQHVTGTGILTYPIPSYNITVTGYAEFEEGYSGLTSDQPLGRRDLNIQSKPNGNEPAECGITVWVFTLDRQTVLGPYSMGCEDNLCVDIDDNEWGTLVYSEYDIAVDVWIGTGSSSAQKKKLPKH
jgi:hypothetical protein